MSIQPHISKADSGDNNSVRRKNGYSWSHAGPQKKQVIDELIFDWTALKEPLREVIDNNNNRYTPDAIKYNMEHDSEWIELEFYILKIMISY